MNTQDQPNSAQKVQDGSDTQTALNPEDQVTKAPEIENPYASWSFIDLDKELDKLNTEFHMNEKSSVLDTLNLVTRTRYQKIAEIANSNEETESKILARELYIVRSQLQGWFSVRSETDCSFLSTEAITNLVFDQFVKDMEYKTSLLAKYHVPDVSLPPVVQNDEESTLNENNNMSFEERISYPNSIYGISKDLLKDFVENFQLQIKFTADITKFLKREVSALDELRSVNQLVEDFKMQNFENDFDNFETYPEMVLDSSNEIKSRDFRRALENFRQNIYEKSNSKVFGILAKDVILLKTLIGDMQSLMIENITTYLNSKNKVKA